MTTNMNDLRQRVAGLLRETLHGREIDTIEMGQPEIPHMLGIVPIGAISTAEVERGTLIDPTHDFWDDYEKNINTKNKAKKEVRTAMLSLKEDDILNVMMPYGDDAGIMYVEVEQMNSQSGNIETSCAECGATILTEAELSMAYGKYSITFRLDCPECEFESKATETLRLQE